MGWRVVSDRAAGGRQRVAWGQRARGAAARWCAGGSVWREVFAGDAVRSGSQEGARAGAGRAHRQASSAAAGQRLESEFRSKESAEGLASVAGIGLPTWGGLKWPPPPRRDPAGSGAKAKFALTGKLSARPAGKP